MRRIIFVFFLLAFCVPTIATVLVRVPFNEQALKADLVVVGAAVRIERAEREGFPFRRVIISVTEAIAGEAPGTEIAVLQPGGKRSNGNEVQVVGVKPIKPGEELLLFLRRLPGGEYEIIGLNQGQYPVKSEPGTGRKVIQIKESGAEWQTMTLDSVKSKVHAIRANAAAKPKPGEKKP